MKQNAEQRARNRSGRSQLKTQTKTLRAAITAGDAETAQKLLAATAGALDKAARKGVVHDNAASRTKSRLARKVNAMSAERS
jgi:small subunit ribosomal protein S20